jgi:Xaa-Pro aminopeptidase
MRYQPLPVKFHADNRRRLANAIGPDAIAVIDTAEVQYRSGDCEYPFRPDSNFYYLTGIAEPESVLVLVPGHPNADARELLFQSGTSEFVGTWEGDRLTPEAATKLSGIKTVMPLTDLGPTLERLLQRYQVVYATADPRATGLRETAPMHQLHSALPILGEMRTIKHPAEIAQIRRAVEITHSGLKQAWSKLRPGMPEYALEGELTGEYLRQGAQGHGFPPIVASGKSTTVLHYMKNDATVADGDLVLLDTGAEVGWYAADISRTVPAGGRFTDRQRAVYEAVLRAQRAGIKLHKPGATIAGIDEQMRKILTDEIKKLGLKQPLRAYYPHLSHHLGLDVHDTGDARLKLAPGMVVTCEPGLYLKEEGIGVRLEDDILITEDGCEVLSRDIPSDPDGIENLLIRG